MSITVVQSKAVGVQSGTTFTGSFTSTPTVGNAVIVLLYAAADGTITGTVDNQSGNSYSTVIEQLDFQNSTSHSGQAFCAWCSSLTSASGTFTVTVTPTTGADGGSCGMLLLEVSGLSGSIDQTGGSNGGSSTTTSVVPTGAGANSNANELAVYAMGARFASGNGAFFSAGATSGWTSPLIYNNNSQGLVAACGYKILSALETTSATSQTLTTGTNMAGIVATFKAPATGPNQYYLPVEVEM